MTIKTTLPGGTWVEVSVSDSGTGIPEHKHDSIFDTYYTTKERGTGLGLSIARTIIETYEGKIWAENQAGGGAVGPGATIGRRAGANVAPPGGR